MTASETETIYFTSDYVRGAHPEVLLALAENNHRQMPGYGEDDCCLAAANTIRNLCGMPDAGVHFVPGGTQANLLAIAAALRPHQGVLAATTGHISVHETGAIEATGHKVLQLPGIQGKLGAAQVWEAAEAHRNDPVREHTVQPKMVYISCPTEYGTLYTRKELLDLRDACRQAGLFLYLDGARLGYGLCATGADIDLPLLAECCDAFTIGGTKLGTLFGEALVIPNVSLGRDFRYIEKQRGAMLAKGWLLGLQFETMLAKGDDCLYYQGARHALALAGQLAAAFEACAIPMLMPAATNQLFPILPNTAIAALSQRYVFEEWEKVDDSHTAVRFCTAWSTEEAHVVQLIDDLKKALA